MKNSAHASRWGTPGAIGLLIALTVNGCATYQPPPPPPPPPRDPCIAHFDVCRCDIAKFSIPNLEARLRQPTTTSWQREEKAANLSDVAVHYKNRYWERKQPDDAIRALRFYDAYLGLIAPSDRLGGYALLHSVALYCGLGCRNQADRLATELRRGGFDYRRDDLGQAYSYCR